MIVLGIDPGFKVTGYGILKKEGNKSILIDYGCLKMKSTDVISARVGIFYNFFSEKIKDYAVNSISLETPFLGKNAQNFLKLGYLRGILYLLADLNNLKIFEFSPREVKLSITGFGGADKEQVSRVILRLFPFLSIPEQLDITDALAVSVCGLFKQSVLI